MKVLHVIHSADASAGGPIEGVKQLAIEAKRRGQQVDVVSLDAPQSPFIKSFPLPLYPLGPGKLKYGFSRKLVPWLRHNSNNYDVVVINGIWQYHSFGVWRALRRSGPPYVAFTHGMLDPWFRRKYPLKHVKKWLYWPWADYRVLRDAQAVLFTCEEERRLARQSFGLYQVNEMVVNYGTAGPPAGPNSCESFFLERFPHLAGQRLALFIGRIHPKKGCDLALAAFANVLAREPNWHLVIAGPDQIGWQSQLMRLAHKLGISNRITWTGMIDGDLKWGAYQSCEILLFPSHQENFGIVVAEALACGVPVLISDKVNIWREVEADGAGLVARDTIEGASFQLQTWCGMTEQQRNSMRVRANACFRKRFEISNATETFFSILSTVASRRLLHST